MVLPNPFVLAEEARGRQSLLLEEAEIYRMHRAAHLHSPGRPNRLQHRVGNLLIVAGEWLRGHDEQTANNHHHTPASA